MANISLSRLMRTAFRNKGLTWINITGLSLGLAVALFLLVYLNFEFSFDRHFKDADRIYRVLTKWDEGGKITYYPINFESLAPTLEKDIPEVEVATRLYQWGNINLRYESGEKASVKTYMVDSSFLQVFDFKLLYGDLEGALNEPNTCVITRSTAERFFGVGNNPVGKSLMYEDYKTALEVKAVIENIPLNTHFNFDLLSKLPKLGFGGLEYYTYVKFKPGTDYQAAANKCSEINKQMLETRFGNFNAEFGSITEPLLDIHTSTLAGVDLSPKSSKSNLVFIILVTAFVLAIALSNFVSLYIIQGEKRATEISVRKTNGAERRTIIRMLFEETFFVTLLAFAIAILLYYSFSGMFARLVNFNLPDNVGVTGMMWGTFVLLFLVVAVVAGGYPAYYLSRFNPIELVRKSALRKYKLTATSVVVQFSVVIFCISALFVVYRQLDYMRKMPLGFDAENVLTVGVSTYAREYDGIYSDLKQFPEIVEVGIGQGHPLDGYSGQGIRRVGQSEKEEITTDERRTGPGYFRVYNIPLIEGRELKYDNRADSNSIVLSEKTVADLELKEPIGQSVIFCGRPYKVVGVAKDLHTSAREAVERVAYSAYSTYAYRIGIRFEPGKYQQAKANIDGVIKKHFGDTPYTTVLLTDVVNRQYRQDEVTSRILLSGAVLAIALALLGLLALTGFVAHQKRKEISVRRVMGAQVDTIVYDLNRYILTRILPAVPIGIILSYYAMSRWLESFVYSINLSWWIFAGALLLTFTFVILTILYQSLKAAIANPVDALKSE